MKIALCSKGNFSLEKGFTKNRIELAESLERLGWSSTFVDKNLLRIPNDEKYNPIKHSQSLKDFLIRYSENFDVVLYEYDTLPFNRKLFNPHTLFVARPAILAYHFSTIKFRYNFKARVSQIIQRINLSLNGRWNDSENELKKIQICLEQADLIQVQNYRDMELLTKKGFSQSKIVVVPNGITKERFNKFSLDIKNYDKPYQIAFVGSFDFRKGAMDFPFLLSCLKWRFPTIRLKLLGSKGLFSTKEEILKFFPRNCRSSIDIVTSFKSEELPELLQGCHVGVFPSYLESFGFGALEMMGAGIPVVAYDAPGPSDFILPDLLVPTGDIESLTQKVIMLLEDNNLLIKKSIEARSVVKEKFIWENIAEDVDEIYRARLDKRVRILA